MRLGNLHLTISIGSVIRIGPFLLEILSTNGRNVKIKLVAPTKFHISVNGISHKENKITSETQM